MAVEDEAVRVHMILREGILDDRLTQLLDHLRANFGIRNINEKRLRSFGILTADISRASLKGLRDVPEIESFQEDMIRHINLPQP